MNLNLPDSPNDYLAYFRSRAFNDVIVTKTDLETILEELRAAYVKYEDIRPRLMAMAGVIKTGIAAKESLYFKKHEVTVQEVQEALV